MRRSVRYFCFDLCRKKGPQILENREFRLRIWYRSEEKKNRIESRRNDKKTKKRAGNGTSPRTVRPMRVWHVVVCYGTERFGQGVPAAMVPFRIQGFPLLWLRMLLHILRPWKIHPMSPVQTSVGRVCNFSRVQVSDFIFQKSTTGPGLWMLEISNNRPGPGF